MTDDTTIRKKQISTVEIMKLARIGMTQKQIASYFSIGKSTFEHAIDYVEAFNEGKAEFAKSILEKQYTIAMDSKHKDQSRMLIHLGRVSLEQAETQNVNNNISTRFEDLLEMKEKLGL